MTSALVVPGWLAVLNLLLVIGLIAAVVVLSRRVQEARAEAGEVFASTAADAESLREELDALERRLVEQAEQAKREPFPEITVVDDREYVITELATQRRGGLPAVPTLPAPVFVDVMLRESLIRTASLAAGLRKALAPEVRNRIRFEMKREVKRSRKRRRINTRLAVREWEARHRAGIDRA